MSSSILVTGCTKGVGLGLIRQLTRSPDLVNKIYAASRRTTEELDKEIRENSSRVRFIDMDSSSESSIKSAALKVGKDLGDKGLNFLINNAAIGFRETIEEIDAHKMNLILQTNVTGPTIAIKEFLPLLEKAAKNGEDALIVNVSSYIGSFATTNHDMAFAYRVSKAALNMLTHSMDVQLRDRGIHILSLHPGYVRTEMVFFKGNLSIDNCAQLMLDNVIKNPKPFYGKFVNYAGQVLPW